MALQQGFVKFNGFVEVSFVREHSGDGHPGLEQVRKFLGEGLIDLLRLVALADHPKVVAIGETGLDYFRLQEPLEWQRTRFRTHIRAARQCGKPLIIHTRASPDDTIRLMQEEGAGEAGGVMHCFTESLAVAEAAMALGFYISFSGIVTFKNARALQEVARAVPLSRLLIETDSPYLAPVPFRGKTNEPGFLPKVAEKLAELKNVSVEEVAAASTSNFFNLFRPVGNKLDANWKVSLLESSNKSIPYVRKLMLLATTAPCLEVPQS